MHGNVEIGLDSRATTVDGTVHVLRPPCTYVSSGTNQRCRRPAHYEFELDPRNWPGAKPPIIQYSCQEHGKDARTLAGIIRVDTL